MANKQMLSECLTGHKHIYLIGIKGTGVCALAELLLAGGAQVSGSDTCGIFYTDEILKSLGIHYNEGFNKDNVPCDAALVIHSAAYNESNVELAEAARRKIPIMNYPEALGAYSALFDSCGIAGVHGKTTTTALCGAIAAALKLPARVLAGSAVSNFNGRCTFNGGDRFFIAETCEYRRHFLNFKPRRIILTSVESDHQDYYPDYKSIRDAFCEYASMLPPDGTLIYCADDPGAKEVVHLLGGSPPPNSKAAAIAYGFSVTPPSGVEPRNAPWHIETANVQNESIVFKVAAFKNYFTLRVPGMHNVLNATAALALNYELYFADTPCPTDKQKEQFYEKASKAIEEFRGSKRRSEILGAVRGALFMDDYGHHPTAIKTTLSGLKEFYPERKLVVSFMPHTYSRTAALLDEFASAFGAADELILHKIYASAREAPVPGIEEALFERIKKYHSNVHYVAEPLDAYSLAESLLTSVTQQSLFLTLGAGNNWELGKALFEKLSQQQLQQHRVL